jgi:glycosyltransferase involved in cell wall biosynthesis
MADPSVAIITRTQNRPVALDRAVRDILGQRFTDWQLILVSDAGDPHMIEKVVEPYRTALGHRYRFLHRERSEGQAAASNFAIANSQSRYLVLHDDDDSWHPEFLARSIAYLETAGPAIGGVATGAEQLFEHFDGTKFIEIGRQQMPRPAVPVTLRGIQKRNHWPPIAFVYRRAAGDSVGHYRENMRALGDWDFNVRLAQRYELAVIPETLAYWHLRPAVRGPQSAYANIGYKAHLRDLMRLKREWGRFPPLWRYLLWWRY